MPSTRQARARVRMGPRVEQPARICFLYIAQAHHLWHSLSAAVELARRRPDIAVEVAGTSDDVLDYARLIVCRLGGASITWRRLGPAWLRTLTGKDRVAPKVPILAANAALLDTYDVIVAPERTTAALRLMGVRRPKLVYTQHGAGDRGGPFEPRLRRFDLVFAAGAKQRDRMVGEGLVAPERCAVVGYPKFDMVDRLDPPLPHPFGEDRPVVLYNPHFDGRLSSWPKWGARILAAFAEQSEFNLIFAPHLRLFEGRRLDQAAELAAFRDHPAIHVDLGDSSAAVDMTYTRMADIYLGDVSSQVYEFLRRPRPCLFLNPHGVAWRNDESYRHWRCGSVVNDVGHLLHDVREADRHHPCFRGEQDDAYRYTFDEADQAPSVRAADAIADLLTVRRRTAA